MTPQAREAAAIALLDRWLAGEPAEAALTRWARGARYAGSGDRSAVRDDVYAAIRRRRSAASLGGGQTGRGLLLGLRREAGDQPPSWDGARHAPAALSPAEQALFGETWPKMTRGERLDCPDWLLSYFDRALGPQAEPVLMAMRQRAPAFLRVNATRADRAQVTAMLSTEGVQAKPHPLAAQALEVLQGARRVRATAAWRDGLIELQDAASQAVAARFAAALPQGARVLDFCAGGGGKALALAAMGHAVSAHDSDPARMRDLPERARRARVSVPIVSDTDKRAPWPAVLVDAPCSGSGSWRRTPEAKWTLSPERLAALVALQDGILDEAAALVDVGGLLGFATCSLFCDENEDRIEAFLARHSGWKQISSARWSPLQGGDGFFLALLRRNASG